MSGCVEEVADVSVVEDELEFEEADEEDEDECERDRDAGVSVVSGEIVAVFVDVEEAVEDAEGVRLCDEGRSGDFGGRGGGIGAEMELVDMGMGILDGGTETAALREGMERLARGRGRSRVAQNGDTFVAVLDNGLGACVCLVGEWEDEWARAPWG